MLLFIIFDFLEPNFGQFQFRLLSNDHVARIPFPHLFGHDLTPFMSTKRNFEKHLLVLWNKNWGDSCQWVQKIWHQQEWQPFSFHEKITAWKQLFFVCFRKRKGWTMRRTSKCAICTWAKLVTFLPFSTYRVTNKRAFFKSQWVIPLTCLAFKLILRL